MLYFIWFIKYVTSFHYGAVVLSAVFNYCGILWPYSHIFANKSIGEMTNLVRNAFDIMSCK